MTPIQTSKHVSTQSILSRAVCLVLSCHRLGNNRKVDLDDLVDVAGGTAEGLDEEQFHATMRLLAPKELRPANRPMSQAKHYLKSIGLAVHGAFGEGTYLIPLERVEEADAELTRLAAEVETEAYRLAYGRYAEAQAEQAVKLGPLYNATQYKTPAQVARAFSIEWHYVAFNVPENIENISAAVAISERAKFAKRLTSAFDEAVLGCRAAALEVVRDLERKLTPGEDGKPKVLRGTALRDIQTFMANLPARAGMTGDGELEDVMARIGQMADGLDVTALRDSAAVRAEVQRLAGQARVALEGLVETGRRAISFDEVPA